jgi:hypothetical protein
MDVDSKRPRGYVNDAVTDSKYGRRWIKRGDSKFPILYSRMGQQLRNTKLHRTICRWVIGTPNWIKLISDPYRKRWPLYKGLRASLFAEFATKAFANRTIAEKMHTLPFFGVGGKLWRGTEGRPHSGSFFIPRCIEYQMRPWKAEIRGDVYMNGMKIRQDVAPLGKSVGKWNYEAPHGSSRLHYRPPFPDRTVPYV